MSNVYTIAPTPPQTYEVITAVKNLLAADATLRGYLGASVASPRIYEDRQPEAHADRFIVVREPVEPGARRENVARYDNMPVQVLVEVDDDHPLPRQFLSAVHARVFALLVSQKPALTLATAHLPIERRRRPSAAAYDADDRSYYSAAEYRLLLIPTDE